MGNHRPGSDKTILAQCHAADDGCIRPNGGALFNKGSLVLVFAFDVTARIDHVGEDRRRPTEDVIFKFYTGIYGNIILDLYSISNFYAWTDHDVLPEIAVASDL